MEPTPLARLLSGTLRLVVDEMHERLAEQGFGDLRPLHGYLLNAAAGEGMTASALASVLGVTKQAMAKVVSELVALGYVERTVSADDARRRPVVLTARGRSALDASARIQRDLEREWAAAVGSGRAATARRALEGMLATAVADGRPVPLRPVW